MSLATALRRVSSPLRDLELFGLEPVGILGAMRALVEQKDYPCIAALASVKEGQSRWGVYREFGSGQAGAQLREDLAEFLAEQRETDSDLLSFWAIYDGKTEFTEEEFEHGLWQELASLTSAEQRATDWGNHNSDPDSRHFSFCLFGEPFFVVGLHMGASRRSRRFARPALVFNVFRQFESLQRRGAYEPMVRSNRRRDLKFEGSVNPMVEKYGDEWETIQFSGRANSGGWKCPFRFLHKKK